MQFAEIKNEFEWISSLEVDQVHWDRAGKARLLRVNNVIVIIAKIHVVAMLDVELIEVVLGPAKNLKYYCCKLFEGLSCLRSQTPDTNWEARIRDLSDTGLDIVCGV